MTATPTTTSAAARAHWVRNAGLAEPVGGGLADLLRGTGWLRTLGGVDPALALLARRPGLSMEVVADSLGGGALAVVPAVRNCMYVVPDSSRAAAVAEARSVWEPRIAREAPRAGIADGELESLADLVLEVLSEPMTTDRIRSELPDGSIRSLGEAGRAVGISSTLPPTLRMLEFTDRIRRRPVDGRIDTEQHTWEANPAPVPDERPLETRRGELVADYVAATGPVTAADIGDWLGASKRATAAAIGAAGCTEVEIEDFGPAFVSTEQLDALLAAEPLDEPLVRLLGFEDLALVAHTPGAWFAPEHHGLRLPVWGRGSHTLGGAHHLAMRTVLIGHHMAGFWAWDPEARAVEVVLLESTDAATAQALGEVAEATTMFLRDNFGHARMTSIDGEATEKSRLDAVRAIAG